VRSRKRYPCAATIVGAVKSREKRDMDAVSQSTETSPIDHPQMYPSDVTRNREDAPGILRPTVARSVGKVKLRSRTEILLTRGRSL